MPKGYIIARINVTDPVAYAEYAKAATEAIRKHGGKPLVRGGQFETLEGEARPRNVVIEFDSYEKAREYYFSTDYQVAKALRMGKALADLVLVEGAA